MPEVVVHVNQSTPWWQWVTAVALLIATLALVYVTWKLVAATKMLSTSLRVALADWYFCEYMFLEIHNAGTGAAHDVDVKIRFETTDGSLHGDARTWRPTTLPAGTRVRFNPPSRGDYLLKAEDLAAEVARIRVVGTALDTRDKSVPINVTIDDLGGCGLRKSPPAVRPSPLLRTSC